jgi:PIN domain nuclease of toxin-antitoxin system
VRVLLDTVALVCALASPQRLSRRARAALENPRFTREVSALSLSEIAIKNRRRDFEISEPDLSRGLEDLDVRILPYTREHALKLFELPWHHTDPFDRQILAQALVESIPVITSDEIFRRYQGIRGIW